MSDTRSEFRGFPQAQAYFGDLKANNNRQWFEDNRARYDREVLEPAFAFIEALGAQLAALDDRIHHDTRGGGRGSIFRIHRDVRFAKDKSPYKTNLGILFWRGDRPRKMDNPGFYFHLDADSCVVYAGQYQMTPEQLDRYREVVSGKPGARLEEIVVELSNTGFPLGEPHLKRVPRGFAADHPRADLLRYKGLATRSGPLPEKALRAASLTEAVATICRANLSLVRWLDENL